MNMIKLIYILQYGQKKKEGSSVTTEKEKRKRNK